ncbi:MAG TPA: dihydrolipoamide acetyltransferase family protein, partial [Anaerolineae bacterium]|nr:dihydrolipoamide acetyltransferase family protein [Anaerolineae bacterium]
GQGEEATATAAEMEPTMPETELPESGAAGRGRIFASPRARKAARAEGIDLALLAGTGPEGRIIERDVLAYLEAALKITPVARRLAEQAGLDPRALTGSGASGRITKEDVEAAVASAQSAAAHCAAAQVAAPPTLIPIVRPAAAAAEVPVVPMSGVRAVIARRMTESHQTTAPVTLTTEVDATEFVVARRRLKEKLAGDLGFSIGYNDLLIKLVAKALREFPYMNARLQGDSIRQLSDVHVALAVDTDRGLLVPVIRAADQKGLRECARELREVVARAREGKALPDELTGSTFTITNLGMHEIDAFTPIINLPEAAILGVGRIKPQPAVFNGEIAIRQMMWLSLTFDHRLVDGAPAARFLQRIKQLVEEPYLLLS